MIGSLPRRRSAACAPRLPTAFVQLSASYAVVWQRRARHRRDWAHPPGGALRRAAHVRRPVAGLPVRPGGPVRARGRSCERQRWLSAHYGVIRGSSSPPVGRVGRHSADHLQCIVDMSANGGRIGGRAPRGSRRCSALAGRRVAVTCGCTRSARRTGRRSVQSGYCADRWCAGTADARRPTFRGARHVPGPDRTHVSSGSSRVPSPPRAPWAGTGSVRRPRRGPGVRGGTRTRGGRPIAGPAGGAAGRCRLVTARHVDLPIGLAAPVPAGPVDPAGARPRRNRTGGQRRGTTRERHPVSPDGHAERDGRITRT